MWPKERKKIYTTAHIVANSYPSQPTVGMLRYGSLININPSELKQTCCNYASQDRKGQSSF